MKYEPNVIFKFNSLAVVEDTIKLVPGGNSSNGSTTIVSAHLCYLCNKLFFAENITYII